MIPVLKYPPKETWLDLCQRPSYDNTSIESTVNGIMQAVKVDGDAALINYTKVLDKCELVNGLQVTVAEIEGASLSISSELKRAIDQAYANIFQFHQSQIETIKIITTMNGVSCWRESRPIEKVGLYIPGGSAPLFSTVLMLGIPANIAGCAEVIMCSPPQPNGSIHPATLYAAWKVGISKIYKVGGAQAIAAMAFGTATIPKAYKLFGPGNQYVTEAKMQAQSMGLAIDMLAGPSEVLIIADASSNAAYIAADLLAQLEHGTDSQAILLTDALDKAQEVQAALQIQLQVLPRKKIIEQSVKGSKLVVLPSIDDCVAFSNEYAPEHLILALGNANDYKTQIVNAGSVFVGELSCESLGDYASGTNHTLPTNGYSKAYSGVSVDSFIKKITFQEITNKGMLAIGPIVETMASAEGLQAHKNAVSIRLNALK